MAHAPRMGGDSPLQAGRSTQRVRRRQLGSALPPPPPSPPSSPSPKHGQPARHMAHGAALCGRPRRVSESLAQSPAQSLTQSLAQASARCVVPVPRRGPFAAVEACCVVHRHSRHTGRALLVAQRSAAQRSALRQYSERDPPVPQLAAAVAPAVAAPRRSTHSTWSCARVPLAGGRPPSACAPMPYHIMPASQPASQPANGSVPHVASAGTRRATPGCMRMQGAAQRRGAPLAPHSLPRGPSDRSLPWWPG